MGVAEVSQISVSAVGFFVSDSYPYQIWSIGAVQLKFSFPFYFPFRDVCILSSHYQSLNLTIV